MKKNPLARWRANFFTGLAIVLPAVVSIAVVVWLFGTVANITDTLLIFLPKDWTHKDLGAGTMHWYWSLVALLLAVLLIGLVGSLARYYFGKKLIQLVDLALLRVPLLNKIYSTIKQVNQAFSPSSKSSVGFVTGEDHKEVQQKTKEHVFSVFVPTTPNPTSGFLVLVPEKEITKLDMSVADGIKFIISLGAIAPEFTPLKR